MVLLCVGEGTHGERLLLLDTRLLARLMESRPADEAVAWTVAFALLLNWAVAATVAWAEARSRV